MSDYFGALLRSSGLVGRPVAAAEPAIREVDVETPVSAARLAADPAAGEWVEMFETVAALLPTDDRLPTSERTVEAHEEVQGALSARPARLPEPHAAFELASADDRSSIGPHAAPREPPAPAQAEAAKTAAPPNSRVQAALRWVAADPLARSYEAGTPGFASPRSEAAAWTPAPAEPTPALPRNEVATVERTTAVVARPEAALPPRPTNPAGEAAAPIEVSIGSIELRVEAPAAPQTVVRPPPPSAPTAALPSPSRSGLARRSLRRI